MENSKKENFPVDYNVEKEKIHSRLNSWYHKWNTIGLEVDQALRGGAADNAPRISIVKP